MTGTPNWSSVLLERYSFLQPAVVEHSVQLADFVQVHAHVEVLGAHVLSRTSYLLAYGSYEIILAEENLGWRDPLSRVAGLTGQMRTPFFFRSTYRKVSLGKAG